MTRIKAGANPPGAGPKRSHNIQKPKGGNKGGGKPKGGAKSKGNYFGGSGGWKGVNVNRARRIVDGQIRRDVRDMRSQRNEIARQTDELIQDAETDYTRGKADLDHIFGETNQFIDYQNDQIASQHAQARTQANAAKAALQAQLQANAGAVGGQANSEFARLGLSGGDQFMGQFKADAANNQSVADLMSAGNAATLDAMASGASSIGDLLLGMNAASHNSNQGRILNNRNDAVTDFRNDFNDQQEKVNDAIRMARNSRGDILRELLVQMQQTGWSQFMDRQNLGLQRRQLNLQAKDQRFQHNMANRQFAAGRSDAAYSRSSGGSSSNGGSSSGGSSRVGSGGGKVNTIPGGKTASEIIAGIIAGNGGRPKKR